MKFNIIFLTLLLPYIVVSQNQLTKDQVLNDYKILKSILLEGHPNLYQYTSKSTWDSLFTSFEEQTLKTIKSDSEFFRSIVGLTDYVRDGHLIVMRPQLTTIPKLFPLLVKIINKKLYTDTDDFGIPVGSEIISIDGISAKELRKRFMKYAPSDGFNTSKKDRQVEREFGILHFYEFGARLNYTIKYKTPSNQLLSVDVESQSFQSIGSRFPNRNSYFGKKGIGKKEPFLQVIDSLDTALVTLNAFGLNQEDFQSQLKAIFKDVKRKKVEHLIIDIRQNEGGYPENANYAFSYIAKESFIQPKLQHVITSKLPHKAYSKEVINGLTYESFFEKYFQKGLREKNKWIVYAPKSDKSMTPIKKGFKGQVYVLIGGTTFSAGATFALNCKNQGILLIGEETGGGYYSHTGGYPVMYELPNSKIKILMSFVNVKKNVNDQTVNKGTGVLPDIDIQLTVEDLIKGKDNQLDYILQQIANQ